MITVEWHLLVYFIINLITFIWALTKDDYEQIWAFLLFIIILIVSTTIYGGIYWW